MDNAVAVEIDAILAWNEVVFPGSHTAVAEALAGPALSRERQRHSEGR